MFADYSKHELDKLVGNAFSSKPDPLSMDKIPRLPDLKDPLLRATSRSDTEFNWKDEEVLSPVMDQGGCGSCWVMAPAGAIDAAYNIKHKDECIQVSVQHFLNCVKEGFGCGGGSDWSPYKFAKNEGACLASDIPYKAKKNACDNSKCAESIKISDYFKVDVDKLHKTIKDRGPTSISMAISIDFLFYQSGVFNGNCNPLANHTMLMVGYGVDKNINHRYWIVKNSWGTDWGEEGYVKVSRDTDQGDNLCHVANNCILPVI